MRKLSLVLILLCYYACSIAQETLKQKIELNKTIHPTTNLFVHFDKNIYSNNETVYFTAYIIKLGKFRIADHKILAVALIKDLDTAFIKSEKFVIQNGLAFGNITIPDSIITGNYHLLAFTDKLVNEKPELMFKQPILIKANIDPPFKANVKFQEKPNPSKTEHKLIVSVTSRENKFLPKPTTINYRYGKLNKTGKTDLMGQLAITIPKEDNLTDPNIYIKLKNQKDTSFLAMPLPPAKLKARVKFYPQGGSLVDNISSVVGWEATDQQLTPLPLTAFLYKNNVVIDTIETNSVGLGKFNLRPEENAIYTVKLGNTSFADSIYTLPKALEKGLVISLENSVVQDTLRFTLKSTGPGRLLIRVHNFKTCFIDVPFEMVSINRKIKIPLTDIPKGIHTVTVADSLERPLAEHLFFAHYNEKEAFTIETDTTSYKTRQKVSLKLSPKMLQNNAVVSIGVTQENRFSSKNTNDIESYTYIKNEIENAPLNPNGLYYKDKSYLNQILLVRGWRRYTWQQTMLNKFADTIKKTDSLSITGIVTKNKKSLKAPVDLATLGDYQLDPIYTSANGNFSLTHPILAKEYGKRIYLFLNVTDKENHDIEINDKFDKTGMQLSKTMAFNTRAAPFTQLDNNTLVLDKNEKAIRLKEVVIKGTNDTNFNYTRGGFGSNECGDYVCMNDILNCRNHANDPGNTQPIPGVTHKGSSGPYVGCKSLKSKENAKHYIEYSGVRYHKEFYLDDYKDPIEPAFFSTIYWNYATILDAKKDTELSFYTSDITGRFKIVVHGITLNDVIYAEKHFEVKK